jgi:RHS repeat-associated protein
MYHIVGNLYDAVGNRLTETTAKGETAYTYDPANRLTSVNGQAVQWDDNGNMLADGQAVYTYNTANKLVGVTKGTSSIVYAYSGLGDRLKQIADGVTTDYTLDINAGLTQVLQDGKQTYLYGNLRIAQIAETQTGYFLPDALGSMRQMTDPSADLTLARAYDPYGNVVSSSGAGETMYGYTGEIQSGGLVHLRARDYVSQFGRFTSRDTWEGDDSRPLSINKWGYVEGNPVLLSDPSGFCVDYNKDGICEHSYPYPENKEEILSNYVADYSPENHPPYISWRSNIYAEQISINKAPLIDTSGLLKTDFDQAQFRVFGLPWKCTYDKDGKCDPATICNQNYCGQIVLSAAIYTFDNNITSHKVIEELAHPGCSGTSVDELVKYLNKQYQRNLVATSITGLYISAQLPDMLRNKLIGNEVIMPLVTLIDGVHNTIGATGKQNPVRHWVLITGISNQWNYEDENSIWNWVRVLNPFDNRTEYYLWNDFRAAWFEASASYVGLSIQFVNNES